MYTAPPSGDDNDEDGRNEVSESEPARERETTESPVLEETTATTDANWSGTVPADD